MTSSRTPLTEDVLGGVAEMIGPYGWVRKGRGGRNLFERPSAGEITARFSFIVATYPGRVDVSPYVEISHEDIEKAREAITGHRFYTLNIRVQALMGSSSAHMGWVFFAGQDNAEAAERLVSDSLNYGTPFADQFHTLDDVVADLEARAKKGRTIMRQSLAIAHCLQGRTGDALAVLQEYVVQARRNPHDSTGRDLRGFAELFGLPINV